MWNRLLYRQLQTRNLLNSVLVVVGVLALINPVHAQVIDADQDGVPDTVDIDDDNDSILDRFEITVPGADRDSDGDGVVDRLDLDSDNDGIVDLLESGWVFAPGIPVMRMEGGRLLTEFGDNGFADMLETAIDNGRPVFTLANSDNHDGDQVPDYLDLDSDNDGLPDLIEAGLPQSLDSDGNARIDAEPPLVGLDGILDAVQTINDVSCCDYSQNGQQDTIPRNSDGGDLPDFQDLDSDNDGVYDLVEAGGRDLDTDGRVDGFQDGSENPDGVDDAILLLPLPQPDSDGNGTADYLDPQIQFGAVPGVAPAPEPSDGADVADQPLEPDTTTADDGATVSVTSVSGASSGTGPIETGLRGGSGGCSIRPAFEQTTTFSDPLLPGMLFFAITYIFGWRRRQRRLVRTGVPNYSTTLMDLP